MSPEPVSISAAQFSVAADNIPAPAASAPPAAPVTIPPDYWEQRARRYGRRAVFNLAHRDEELDAVTELQRAVIFPALTPLLDGSEKVALDFGCGSGRFTADLAQLIHGSAVGVDPTRELLSLGQTSPGVQFMDMPGGGIPLPDGAADMIFVCLVLGGLRGADLDNAVREIGRVLRPGGLLALIENTSELPDAPHWVFRSVEQYQRILGFVSLRHLTDYQDAGERISMMAGRTVT
jgi:SAM-dependent methyltransferase